MTKVRSLLLLFGHWPHINQRAVPLSGSGGKSWLSVGNAAEDHRGYRHCSSPEFPAAACRSLRVVQLQFTAPAGIVSTSQQGEKMSLLWSRILLPLIRFREILKVPHTVCPLLG